LKIECIHEPLKDDVCKHILIQAGIKIQEEDLKKVFVTTLETERFIEFPVPIQGQSKETFVFQDDISFGFVIAKKREVELELKLGSKKPKPSAVVMTSTLAASLSSLACMSNSSEQRELSGTNHATQKEDKN